MRRTVPMVLLLVAACAPDGELKRKPTGAQEAESKAPTEAADPAKDKKTEPSASAPGGGTPAAACKDADDEAPATEDKAKALEATSDCAATERRVWGMIAGAKDVDQYVIDVTDDGGVFSQCYLKPTARVIADGIARVCMFPKCKGGKTLITKCNEGSAATSDSGLPGCCGTGTVSPEYDCEGTLDDSAQIHIRVDQPSGEKCVAYELVTSFNE